MRTLLTSLFISLCAFSSLAQTKTDSTKSNQRESTFTYAEILPQFPGGKEAFQKFIYSNLKYPADAKAQGIEGIVVVQYTINVDGTMSDIKIVPGRGLSPSCDQAVIDVFKNSPVWSPAMQNGKPKAVFLYEKVKFTLQPVIK